MAEDKPKIKTMVHGGLHLEDFEWAVRHYESIGYVLVAFVLDFDRYHWRAVFLDATQVPVCKLRVLLEHDNGAVVTPGQLRLKGLAELPETGKGGVQG